MNMPGFTAEESLRHRSATSYIAYIGGGFLHGPSAGAQAGKVVPAIPFCANCPEILERCSRNGGRPRAVCRACAIGDCFSGVENPTPPYPWGW